MKKSRSSVLIVVSTCMTLQIMGCDPAFKYNPQSHPIETISEVRFISERYSVLTGSPHVLYSILIENPSDKEVIVLGGVLLVGDRSINNRVNDTPDGLEARTIAPRSSKEVLLLWDLDGRASKVLKEQITFRWKVRIGDEEHILLIPMQREK